MDGHVHKRGWGERRQEGGKGGREGRRRGVNEGGREQRGRSVKEEYGGSRKERIKDGNAKLEGKAKLSNPSISQISIITYMYMYLQSTKDE